MLIAVADMHGRYGIVQTGAEEARVVGDVVHYLGGCRTFFGIDFPAGFYDSRPVIELMHVNGNNCLVYLGFGQ